MPRIKHKKHKKHKKLRNAKFISLFFIFSVSALLALLFVIPNTQKYTRIAPVKVLPVKATQIDTKIEDVRKITVPAIPKVVKKIKEARLKIPKIGVDAVIKDMGITLEQKMDVPNNGVDVGWYSLGTRPGDNGSAVIGAHNRFNSKDGVFIDLNKLERGDILSIVNAEGVSISFVVRDIHIYDATDTNTGIFESESGIHLNLITCSGDWNPLTKTSFKRLVIFTDLV